MLQPEVSSLPDQLAPLAVLARVKDGAAPYFLSLRHDADPHIAVGAWCALLAARQLANRSDLWEELIAMCRYGAVRSRAFEFFEHQVDDHDLARRVALIEAPSRSDALDDGMRATLAFDAVRGTRSHSDAYLATGDLGWLDRALGMADVQGGWRVSLPWALRMIVISPMSSSFHQRTLSMLSDASQVDLLAAYGQVLRSLGLFGEIGTLFNAAADLYRGEPRSCFDTVAPLLAKPTPPGSPLVPYRGTMLALRAEADEKLGRYREAFAGYLSVKASAPPPTVDPESFFSGAAHHAKLDIPSLPAEGRRDIVQMLGFPRSGTTLLENILDSHPMIETFEEIPSYKAAMDMASAYLTGQRPAPLQPEDVSIAARAKYYEELDIRRRKPQASVLVDKLPIRTSEAQLMRRLFPDWRFIFSIRHPYDVVLSCLKQRFAPNPAMDNLRTFEGAVRIYDYTMTQWFNEHTMEDTSVHYVRYHELVTDFERVVSGVLDFLGLAWDDSVREFAERAADRQALTPSYQKVRKGLSIGVQTHWRNYGFVFQTDAAKPLRKWAEFFGYDTQ